jgi:hypothetical protein
VATSPDEDPGSSEPERGRRGESGKRRRVKWAWLNLPLTVAVIPIVIAALLGAYIYHIQNKPSIVGPRIEVDSAEIVATSRAHSDNVSTDVEKVYFQLRNTGNQLAIIRGVRLEVQQYVSLPVCVTQGYLPSTGNSRANMPVRPRITSIINVPVSQQIAPDAADRFEVSLRIQKDPSQSVYLYRLNASLLYDKLAIPVNAGELLVALPYNPDSTQYFWTRTYQAEHGA